MYNFSCWASQAETYIFSLLHLYTESEPAGPGLWSKPVAEHDGMVIA